MKAPIEDALNVVKALSILASLALALLVWNEALIKWIIHKRQNKLIPALIAVESGGDDNAFNPVTGAAGPLQITTPYLADIHRRDGRAVWGSVYDRYFAIKMFRAYMEIYATPERLGRVPTMEDMARIHHGGPDGWKRDSTKAYWKKVAARL